MDKDFRNYLIFICFVGSLIGGGTIINSYFENKKELRELELKKIELEIKKLQLETNKTHYEKSNI